MLVRITVQRLHVGRKIELTAWITTSSVIFDKIYSKSRLYETGLRQYNPGATNEEIDQEVERSFASWFRDYVYNLANNVGNQALIDLACGPLMQATTYNGDC
ncbi:PREDICTED: uncharacterized protein LOC109178472 [Ipomoea nil]|uniref:uncharacterized protein LOC109178472 n=1 Tax=Ipomoea nil TaxID=35883 RepID=UPI0009009145|nr:PREDICTED: uncharacterized protein LOC109178472 [Ipomoea nil]